MTPQPRVAPVVPVPACLGDGNEAAGARGADINGVGCWCGASDEEHEAPSDDGAHARACVALRRLTGRWSGQVPRDERIAAAIRREIEGA